MSAIGITKATLTIGGTSYEARELVHGVPQSVEEIDVTALNDSYKYYAPADQIEQGVIECKVSAETPPTVGATGTLSATLTKASGGTIAVAVTGYVVAVEPATIAVDGNRVVEWTVRFRPIPSTSSTTTSG